MSGGKHKNYEILNLIGYGLSKFDSLFVNNFGFKSKNDLYNFFISIEISETVGVIKNRQDLFDPFFDNGRRGWWQKGDTYIHRKYLIDSLFGQLNCEEYTQMIKMYIHQYLAKLDTNTSIPPILISKFKRLQETGAEAELFFINNFTKIDDFKKGNIQDARTFGDGYDFQIDLDEKYCLVEVKGVRDKSGSIRLTKNEYKKAQEYKKDYFLVIISDLNNTPKITSISNPILFLKFNQRQIVNKQTYFHSQNMLW